MIDISSFIKQSVLPQNCLLCGDAGGELAICQACHQDLPWLNDDGCPVCALPGTDHAVCGNCLRHPPAFDATRAALQYSFPVDAMLRRYKYSGFLAVAELMGALLTEHVRQNRRPDLLIPMPLHPLRLQERGFNQAAEIARVISRQIGTPLAADGCCRLRPTAPQAGLSLQERHKNLRGAFGCQMDLTGRHVVLIDDVMTTGASLNVLAGVVREAGATRVECWVAARTLRD